eukprot:2904366-Pleurochrysis_carterae.AAC.1
MAKRWHQWSVGCCKLHKKAGQAVGHAVLMIMPRFVAWMKRAKSGRTSLVVEFKVVVVHES